MLFASLLSWKSRHRILADLSVSITVGVATLLFLHFVHTPPLSVVRRAGDDTADRMIRLAEGMRGEPRRSPGFVFIDIDEPTWEDWDHPLITPRDKLAELIERAARAKPLAIVADVDLSFPATPAGEQAMKDLLSGYDPAWPPLLLVRPLIDMRTAGTALPLQRSTPYDDIAARKRNVVWTAPLFQRDGDGVIRRWRLIVPTCAHGQPAVLPSTHLVASLLVREALSHPAQPPANPPVPIWETLKSTIAAYAPAACDKPAPAVARVLDDARGEAPPITLDGTDVSTRVLYNIPWFDDATSLGPAIETGQGLAPLVLVRSARAVTSLPAGEPVPGLDGRLVLVGGGFRDSGDWHRTPLGQMPGAMLLLNAIDALARGGTPKEPGLRDRALVSLGIVAAVSLLTSVFRPIVATAAASLLVLLVMLVSLGHFRSGVVLDLAVPAAAAALSDFARTLFERLRSIWNEGRRWVLKPSPAIEERPTPANSNLESLSHDPRS